jgi:hypothetical protein
MLLCALLLRTDQQKIEKDKNDDQGQETEQASACVSPGLGKSVGNQEIHFAPS